MAEQRDIKYVNREFSDFKTALQEYAKSYFPDTYNDFSETSPGTMFMEMAAYVGDILSFYQDTQLQETFLQYAKEPGNLYTLAYMMGYRPKVTTVSEVDLEVTQTVGAVLVGGEYIPNYNDALTVNANAQLEAATGDQVRFLIDKPINFAFSSSYDPTEVTIDQVDGSNNPVTFKLKKKARAFSGEVKTIEQTYERANRFETFTIDDADIIGVLDITDSSNNTWYEVPFLAQDTLPVEGENLTNDKGEVPYTLTLQSVPRRFVTRFNSQGQLQVQFGASNTGLDDSEFIPDPTNVGFGGTNGISRIDQFYDPINFLHSAAYGLAPYYTTLEIRYLVGGGIAANVPANTITNQVTVTSTSIDGQNTYRSTLAFNNPKPAQGGKDGDTIEELRENSLRAFNEQGRAVTRQDYAVRAASLPPRFGSVAKAYIVQDQLASTKSTTDNIIDSNPLSLSIYVLAYDNEGKLKVATSTLKGNLRQYLSQYRMLTDAVNIKDAFIVNIGIEYEVIVRPDASGRDVLLRCTQALQDYFATSKRSINQPINLSGVYTLLDRVKGVQTVQSIRVNNKTGGNYSEYEYDIKGATKSNIVYPSLDPCIFEIKFPNSDIVGRITTL
jgi:hypothetical protein